MPMEKIIIDLPRMYADHHVIEVRRILSELPGIENIYASSSFRSIELEFDPEKILADDITKKLDEAGYIGDLSVPTETSASQTSVKSNGNQTFFRHTAVYEESRESVSFSQQVSYQGRPLWPCPGFGVIKSMDQES